MGPLSIEIREVEELHRDGEDLDGYYDEGDSHMEINAQRPVRRRLMTELHEVIHAISHFYGLGLSEPKVRVLEMALFQAYSAEFMSTAKARQVVSATKQQTK